MQLKRKAGAVDDADVAIAAAAAAAAAAANPPKKMRHQEVLLPFPTIMDHHHHQQQQQQAELVPEVCPVEVPMNTPVSAAAVAPSLVITEPPDADERAIVLYKPMSSTAAQGFKGFKIPTGWSDALRQRLGGSPFGSSSSSACGSDNTLAVVPYSMNSASSTIAWEEACRRATSTADSDDRGPCSCRRGGVIIEDVTDQLLEEEENSMLVEQQQEDEQGDAMEVEGGEAMAVEGMTAYAPPVQQQQQQFVVCPPPHWQLHSPTSIVWSSLS